MAIIGNFYHVRVACVLQVEIARGKTAAVATAQGSVAVDDATGIAAENAVGVHPVGEFKLESGLVVHDQ